VRVRVAHYLALGVDVANIGGDTCGYVLELVYTIYVWQLEHTRSQADIVERKLANPGVELQEEGQRLANTTRGTKDGDLGRLQQINQHLSQVSMQFSSDLPQTKAIARPRKYTHLACRRREGAARGLGESLPGSEHGDCN